MSEHVELAVSINPLAVEIISEVLISDIGCSGVVMQETAYEDEKVVSDVKNIVKGYIWNNPNNPLDRDNIQSALWAKRAEWINMGIEEENLGSWNLDFNEIKDEEWAHSWKKYWHPMKISSNIVICPTWEEYELKDNEIKIDLDPGSAFGTGTHPTTRLCVQSIEKYMNPGDSIADIGTGSGILAIAAAKLGSGSIVGVDNDPSVIAVAIENAQKNGVDEKINFYEGSATDVNGQYDLVVANILAHILIKIMADLEKLMKSGSRLILSGIIKEQEQSVIDSAIAHNLKYIETKTEDNWVAIIVEKS